MHAFPNPGLSSEFNRYLSSLDSVLPRRSRKGDRVAHLLHSALEESIELSPSAAAMLNDFLKECENFRRQQFWVDAEFANHDDGTCWLPVVVVGHAWSDSVENILQIKLPESLGRARAIILRPVGPTAQSVIRVVLRRKITGVSEAAYDRFTLQVKAVAPRLECFFDVDNSTLEILKGSDIEVGFDDAGAANLPVNGGMPAWLDTALGLNGVERLDMCYPLTKRQVPSICEFVSSICILPDCPVGWRLRDKFPQAEAFQAIADGLGQGPDEPFHLHVTAVEDEWLPLVNAFVSRILLKLAMTGGATGVEDRELCESLVARHLTLHPNFQIRSEHEYDSLKHAFAVALDDSHVLRPIDKCTSYPDGVATNIVERLDDTGYLNAWARYFKKRVRAAIDGLSFVNSVTGSNPVKPPRGVSAEYLIRVSNSIRDFAGSVLASLETTLELLISTQKGIQEGKLARRFIQRELAGEKSVFGLQANTAEQEALIEVLRVTCISNSAEERKKALAALVYFFTEDDVISDSETYGRIDDWFVIATLLKGDRPEIDISDALRTWIRAVNDRVDLMASRSMQEAIRKKYDSLLRAIEAACGRSSEVKNEYPGVKKGKSTRTASE